jgi:hypothetical protein
MDTIKKNTEAVIDSSKVDSPEVNAGRTKHMLLSHHQNVGQNHDVKIANKSFENVAQFRYLGMAVIVKDLRQEEIKRRLNLGNACNDSVQNRLSSCLQSKNVKIIKFKL